MNKSLHRERFPVARELYVTSNTLSADYTAGLIGLVIAKSEFKQEINPHWLAIYRQKIQSNGVNHHRARELKNLVYCNIKKICSLDIQIKELLEIALADTQLSNKKIAKLSWISANFYFHQYDDKKSYQMLLQASQHDSNNSQYIIEAVKVALGAKNNTNTRASN